MEVENSELVPVSEFRDNMTKTIDELKDGQREKIVLTRYGGFECVVISVSTYEGAFNAR